MRLQVEEAEQEGKLDRDERKSKIEKQITSFRRKKHKEGKRKNKVNRSGKQRHGRRLVFGEGKKKLGPQ